MNSDWEITTPKNLNKKLNWQLKTNIYVTKKLIECIVDAFVLFTEIIINKLEVNKS